MGRGGVVPLRPRDDDLRPPRHHGAHVVRHEGVDVAVLVLWDPMATGLWQRKEGQDYGKGMARKGQNRSDMKA